MGKLNSIESAPTAAYQPSTKFRTPSFASRGDDDSLVGTRSSDKGRLVVREQYCWQMRLLRRVHQREKIPTRFADQERTAGSKRRKEKTAVGELHRRGKVEGAALRSSEHF